MLKENTYIFVDESGKPEVYSAKGENLVERSVATNFLILAAVRVESQLELQRQTIDFKGALLRNISLVKIFSPAYALDSFHAQTDYPEVRELFYEFINTLDVKIDVIVVEKLKCYETLKRNPSKIQDICNKKYFTRSNPL